MTRHQNLRYVAQLMDEIFGSQNYIAIIGFRKTAGVTSLLLPSLNDFIIWYGKNKSKTKYHQLFVPKTKGVDRGQQYKYVELANGERRALTKEEINST